MAARAVVTLTATTGTGDVIPNATVTVRQVGTTTNITETIYSADDPDLSQYTNGAFFTSATGEVTFFLTNPKRVDVLFTKSGFTSVTRRNVNVSLVAGDALTIQDEGVSLPVQPILNITGAGATATNDAGNGRTNVAIAGGGLATDPLWDAAGDTVYGTGADTAARLAKGTAGQLYRMNAGATAPEWVAPSAVIPTNDAATVATSEFTTSDVFTDLATAGPAVTVTTGTKALVIVSTEIRHDTADSGGAMGFAVSGATTLAADLARAIWLQSSAANRRQAASWAGIVEGLTAGSNTFTAKYQRTDTGTATFERRHISVIDMGS